MMCSFLKLEIITKCLEQDRVSNKHMVQAFYQTDKQQLREKFNLTKADIKSHTIKRAKKMFLTFAGAGVHGLMPVAETNNDSIKHTYGMACVCSHMTSIPTVLTPITKSVRSYTENFL